VQPPADESSGQKLANVTHDLNGEFVLFGPFLPLDSRELDLCIPDSRRSYLP